MMQSFLTYIIVCLHTEKIVPENYKSSQAVNSMNVEVIEYYDIALKLILNGQKILTPTIIKYFLNIFNYTRNKYILYFKITYPYANSFLALNAVN
jgi:hypothetical protein